MILIIIELVAEMRFLETHAIDVPENTESPIAHVSCLENVQFQILNIILSLMLLTCANWTESSQFAHLMSITILFLFLIEILVKVYAFGFKGFLEHKFEVSSYGQNFFNESRNQIPQ